MKHTIWMFALIPGLCSQVLAGQPKAPISRTIVEKYEIPGTTEEIEMILVEYQPGAASSPHLHPVVGLNYIISGTAESQYDGEPLRTFHAGDSYQDPANRKHLIFRNASRTEPLKFLIACRIQRGQPFVIPFPDTQ